MALRKKTLAIPLTGPLERRNGGEDLTANLTALPAVPRALNVYRSRTGEWKQRPGHSLVSFGEALGLTDIIGGVSVGGQQRLITQWADFARGDTDSDYHCVTTGASDSIGEVAIGARSRLLRSAFPDPLETTRCQSVAVAVAGGVALSVTRVGGTFAQPYSYCISASRVSDGSPVLEAESTRTALLGVGRAHVVYSSVHQKFVVVITQPGVPSTAATTISAYVVSPADILSGAANLGAWASSWVSLATDAIGTATSVNTHFDVIVEEDVGSVIVAYRGTAGNTRALRFNPSTGLVSTGPVTVVAGGDVAANGLAWARAEQWPQTAYRLFTAINSAVGVVDRKITKATLVQSASTTVLASPGNVGAITGWIAHGYDGSSATDGVHAVWDTIGAAASRSWVRDAAYSSGAWVVSTLNSTGTASMRLHGHAFLAHSDTTVQGKWAVVLCGSIDSSGKLFFASASGLGFFSERAMVDRLAVALNGISDFVPIAPGHLGMVSVYDGDHYYGATQLVSRSGDVSLATTSEDAFIKCGRIVKVSLTGNRLVPLLLDSNTALFPGSSWTKSDGQRSSGANWPDYQSGPVTSVTGVTVGGTPLLAGDYYYTTLPVVISAGGRRWTGLPSVPVKATLVGPNNSFSVTLTQAPCDFNGALVLELYRTKKDGTQSFRLMAFERSQVSVGAGYVFQDNVTDAQLETGLQLYSDSGELIHVCPPPSTIAWVAGNRILTVDSENPTDVWASSEFTPGEGPWFHPDVRISVPGGEEIVAGAFMDGRSFLFTRKSIFAVAGAWPGRTGAGQLPEVQRVATGVGGYSPESTVVTAEGIWFYSEDRGQCLLNRGLAVVPAGKIVDGVITSPPVAAIQAEGFDQVRFYLSTGVVAVYDQVERAWSHWQIATAAMGGEAVRGAFVHGRDVYVFTSTRLLKEDAAARDDAGTAFDVGVDARLPIGPPGGKVRVYRLILSGLCYGDTTLTATVFNDFGNVGSGEDVKTAVIKARPGETTPAIYEQTFRPKRGRCDSMLLRLSYLSTDPGITFRALAAEIGAYNPATVARPGSSRQA